MRRYDSEHYCPKCGNKGADVRYSCGEIVLGLDGHYFSTATAGLPMPERLIRICRDCGYEWLEKPLDAEGD